MKPKFAVIVFLFFTISSVLSGMKSFNDTREMVDADLHQALVLTLAAQDHTIITPDTTITTIPMMRLIIHIPLTLNRLRTLSIAQVSTYHQSNAPKTMDT